MSRLLLFVLFVSLLSLGYGTQASTAQEPIGHYAYLAQGSDGIHLLNISSPANPKEVALYDTPGTAWGVTVSDGYAYVADGGE
jgi:hypothetical protein